MIIVDTSVIAKLFFPEEGSEQAKKLLLTEPLGTPDLLLYEFTNLLAYRTYLSLEDKKFFLKELNQLQLQLFVLPQSGFERVTELCQEFHITAYDASFIALAERLKLNFITADLKLARQVKGLSFVHTLS